MPGSHLGSRLQKTNGNAQRIRVPSKDQEILYIQREKRGDTNKEQSLAVFSERQTKAGSWSQQWEPEKQTWTVWPFQPWQSASVTQVGDSLTKIHEVFKQLRRSGLCDFIQSIKSNQVCLHQLCTSSFNLPACAELSPSSTEQFS